MISEEKKQEFLRRAKEAQDKGDAKGEAYWRKRANEGQQQTADVTVIRVGQSQRRLARFKRSSKGKKWVEQQQQHAEAMRLLQKTFSPKG